MNRLTIAAVLWAALAAAAAGEVKAVIDGPDTAAPGDLVVLSGTQSIGDGFRWVAPDGIATLNCSVLELAFASGTPGKYTFQLIAADTEAKIDHTTHTVEITGWDDRPGPGPDPPDPDPEPEPPAGDYEHIERASQSSAERLNDIETAGRLARAIQGEIAELEGMCKRGQCPGLAQAKAEVVAVIRAALAMRQGNSRNVDWLGGWREPMNSAIDRENITLVNNYLAAMKAAARGLAAAVR